MPQPIEMGPALDMSTLTTPTAVAVAYEFHDHAADGSNLTYESVVFYPINEGHFILTPVVCASCFCEVEKRHTELVTVR